MDKCFQIWGRYPEEGLLGHMVKETINKKKRQQTDWEKIFTNNTFDKRLIFKIYKERIHLNNKKPNNSVKKWTDDPNTYFSQENTQMANRHMKRCSNSLAIREMQIKTTMRYYFKPVRMAIINRMSNNKC